jgi:hypothetical protein
LAWAPRADSCGLSGVVQGGLAEAMTEEMKDSQKVTVQLAKVMVCEVLEDPETPMALKSLLADPDLR